MVAQVAEQVVVGEAQARQGPADAGRDVGVDHDGRVRLPGPRGRRVRRAGGRAVQQRDEGQLVVGRQLRQVACAAAQGPGPRGRVVQGGPLRRLEGVAAGAGDGDAGRDGVGAAVCAVSPAGGEAIVEGSQRPQILLEVLLCGADELFVVLVLLSGGHGLSQVTSRCR